MRPNFLRLAAVGVAVTAVLGTASVTAAADRSGGPKTTFTSETSAPTEVFGFVGGAPDPARCNPADGRCLLPYAGHDALDGDLVGALDSAGAVSMDLATGQGHAATLSLFRGTVAGCPGPARRSCASRPSSAPSPAGTSGAGWRSTGRAPAVWRGLSAPAPSSPTPTPTGPLRRPAKATSVAGRPADRGAAGSGAHNRTDPRIRRFRRAGLLIV